MISYIGSRLIRSIWQSFWSFFKFLFFHFVVWLGLLSACSNFNLEFSYISFKHIWLRMRPNKYVLGSFGIFGVFFDYSLQMLQNVYNFIFFWVIKKGNTFCVKKTSSLVAKALSWFYKVCWLHSQFNLLITIHLQCTVALK